MMILNGVIRIEWFRLEVTRKDLVETATERKFQQHLGRVRMNRCVTAAILISMFTSSPFDPDRTPSQSGSIRLNAKRSA